MTEVIPRWRKYREYVTQATDMWETTPNQEKPLSCFLKSKWESAPWRTREREQEVQKPRSIEHLYICLLAIFGEAYIQVFCPFLMGLFVLLVLSVISSSSEKCKLKPPLDITSDLSEWLSSINQQTTSACENVEKGTIGGNAYWCSHCGKQYGDTSKN